MNDGKCIVLLRRISYAHFTFNGAMRWAQGGKPARQQVGLSTDFSQLEFILSRKQVGIT